MGSCQSRHWPKNLNVFFSGKAPVMNPEQVAQKDDIATRAASANVLGWLAKNVENMIVASADLSNSDKTDGFLKNTKAFTKGDFSGAFLQAGVAELTMACCCQWHCPAWRSCCCLRNLFCILRLYETCCQAGCPDGFAGKICMDA